MYIWYFTLISFSCLDWKFKTQACLGKMVEEVRLRKWLLMRKGPCTWKRKLRDLYYLLFHLRTIKEEFLNQKLRLHQTANIPRLGVCAFWSPGTCTISALVFFFFFFNKLSSLFHCIIAVQSNYVEVTA